MIVDEVCRFKLFLEFKHYICIIDELTFEN